MPAEAVLPGLNNHGQSMRWDQGQQVEQEARVQSGGVQLRTHKEFRVRAGVL
jgi:hypothetical protein